ncbi:MAG: hypothetical protein CTY33_09235 [Methylotenera sp.]|nr:MAG: hypothetical protein CTY33_09235 [Methylotenera sp.]
MDNKFETIEYKDIDLHKTKDLLNHQGLLYVELGWFRTKTMIMLLDTERKLNSARYRKGGKIARILEAFWDIIYVTPLLVFSSNLIVLHCIFVNNCLHAEWEKLENGNHKFTFL